MTWSGIRIKTLRSRLGWSRNDLARRLECDAFAIREWEMGNSMPDFEMTRLLELFENHAELNSIKIRQESIADMVLNTENLEQINHAELFKQV